MHRNIVSGGQFRIVTAPIFDTKVIVAAVFNQVNMVYSLFGNVSEVCHTSNVTFSAAMYYQ